MNSLFFISQKITNFYIFKFGLLAILISNNDMLFSNNTFKDFYTSLGIKQKFTSIEHPQSNG